MRRERYIGFRKSRLGATVGGFNIWRTWLASCFPRWIVGLMIRITLMLVGLSCSLTVRAQQPIELALPIQVSPPLAEFPIAEAAIMEAAPKWTIDTLVEIAVGSSPSIHEARARVEAARGNALQVGLRSNPNVGLDFQQMFSDGQAEQYGISYDQRLERKQKLVLNRAVATHEMRRLEQRLAVELQRVVTDVHIAFVQLQRNQYEERALNDLTDINRQAVAWAKDLFAADEVAKTDVMQADLELQRVHLQLREAQLQTTSAQTRLESIVGQQLPGVTGEVANASFLSIGEPMEYQDVLSQLLTRNPLISERMAEIERARCYLQRQIIEPKADVTLRGLLNVADNGVGGRPNAGLAVSVPWPIHDRNQGAIYEAKQQLIAAEQELERMQRALAAQLAPIHGQYMAARGTAASYQAELIPRALETLALIQQTYQAGEASFNSLLTAQRTVAELQLQFLQVLERAKIAAVRMDGLLLSGSLSTVLRP